VSEVSWGERVMEKGKRYLTAVILDAVLVFIAYGSALLLRFFPNETVEMYKYTNALPLVIVVQLFFNYLFGIYKRAWRFASIVDAIALGQSVLMSTSFIFIFSLLEIFGRRMLPISVIVVGGILTFLFLAGSRFFHRVKKMLAGPAPKKHILIVGAGSAGQMLARELINRPEIGYKPVGFIDDDKSKHGLSIHGIPVLGPRSEIAYWAEQLEVDTIAIAMPSAPSSVLRETISLCEPTSARIRIFSGITGSLNSMDLSNLLREVRIDDLLNREPVNINLEQCKNYIEGKTVLVTGAAGSIGSELCRQLSKLSPKRLILVDINESELYNLSTLLASDKNASKIEFIPLLCNIVDSTKVNFIMSEFKPDIIFHAAAYKHVPVLEQFPEEAFWTNIIGTVNVLTASADCVERFVFVSTDKAASPTNVLGFSKRIGEILTSSMGQKLGRPYCSVRFGNVLGSRGSVVPIFMEQIDRGGPVTVTHPEMKRFFMTIPEATLLIVQAGAFEEVGVVYILDMGEEVKIYDLARKLIRLRGYRIEDIKIEFIGPRKGERLTEVLHDPDEKLIDSPHPQIKKIYPKNLPEFEVLLQQIDQMKSIATLLLRDELIKFMKQILISCGVSIKTNFQNSMKTKLHS